jgi:hypothetical protein
LRVLALPLQYLQDGAGVPGADLVRGFPVTALIANRALIPPGPFPSGIL